jgi:thiol-disulfide isomerase/thioredoxin
MKRLRYWVPLIGIFALIALFLKMPEVSAIFGLLKCQTCAESSPYLPLIGCGYFTLLIALSMLFPTFPGPLVARAGLIWAVLLGLAMTYIDWPGWCAMCIIGHVCNLLIWAIWCLAPPKAPLLQTSPFKQRLFLLLLAPISLVALFTSLNLTLMIYNPKIHPIGLQPGQPVPQFAIHNENGTFTNATIATTSSTWINFVSPNCPYCKEQLSILNDIAAQLYPNQWINISASLSSELIQQSPATEWFEDKEGALRELFKVTGYPTLFLVGPSGTILQVIAGIPSELKESLLAH